MQLQTAALLDLCGLNGLVQVPCNFFPFRAKEITEPCWANF